MSEWIFSTIGDTIKVIPPQILYVYNCYTGGGPKKSRINYRIYFSERVLQKDVYVTLRDMSMRNDARVLVSALYSSTLYTCMHAMCVLRNNTFTV